MGLVWGWTAVVFFGGLSRDCLAQGVVLDGPSPTASRIVSGGNDDFPTAEFSTSSEFGRGTVLSVPAELDAVVRLGTVPDDLATLRAMERQQRRVAELANFSTVNVQIGPSQGCGVIITASGYVLTAAHVAIRPGKEANVTLSDGRTVRATSLGLNRQFDAGLLKIDSDQGSNWPHAALGKSGDLIPGMWCIATGHPGGYDGGRGVVTRMGRILEASPSSILTDCALIGGDSGGPLFDLKGRLIAIHSRIGNDVAENLHVPIDQYAFSWKRMQKGEAWGVLEGFRPVLGVKGSRSAPRAVVQSIAALSPAEKAGLKVGDVIQRFGDRSIDNFPDLRAAVGDTMPGERVIIQFKRGSEFRSVQVEIGRAD